MSTFLGIWFIGSLFILCCSPVIIDINKSIEKTLSWVVFWPVVILVYALRGLKEIWEG